MSWLQDFYKANNIGGAGGVLDQAAIDYWEGEAAKSDPESIKSIIEGTAKAQGTWNKNPITITPQAAPTFTPAASTSSPPSTAGQPVTVSPSSPSRSAPTSQPTYSPATTTPDPTPPIESNTDWIQDAYTAAGLGQADQAGLDYWSGDLAKGQTKEQITSNIALHSPQYKGKEDTAYTRTVPAYTGTYDKDSKNQRVAENEYHQNILDEITRYVEGSGIGDFTKSEGSIPQWMPVSEHDDSYDLDQYRNQSSRATEDLWQQGQIGDLEAWAQSVAGDYGLSFNPSEVYHGYGKDGTTYSTHTNEGMRRNISQSTGIENVVDFISKLDAARAPEIAANKESLSNIYGAEIDETYNELFQTDTGIDQAGKEYWTKDLLENRPGLTEGQDWQVWLEDAFKNTNEYKDFKVSLPEKELDIPGVGDDGQFIDFEAGAAADPAPDFESMLADARSEWGLEMEGQMEKNNTYWSNQISGITDSYTTQMDSLQKMLAESSKNNADILKGYQDQVASYQKSLESQAAYGERPSNQTVKGVKTRNELPGYKPKTGGTTGHFNRKGSRLSTSSLNIA